VRRTGTATACEEVVCAKLDSCGGERVLDIGCGCGSFALHAAREHGVLRHRNHDYGDLADESCDASMGMVEHVGSANIDVLDYARSLSGWARKPRRARRARRIAGRPGADASLATVRSAGSRTGSPRSSRSWPTAPASGGTDPAGGDAERRPTADGRRARATPCDCSASGEPANVGGEGPSRQPAEPTRGGGRDAWRGR
jgi:hypothetical protein